VDVIGQRKIIRNNLERVFPKRSLRQKRKLEHDIIRNLGRGYGELRVLDGFLQSLTISQIEGSGFDALLKAVEIKRPVILVSAHLSNYLVGLYVLKQYGLRVGVLYRTRGNSFLDRQLEQILNSFGQMGFKISHRKHRQYESNLLRFIDFLKAGNVVVMLADHRVKDGTKLDFLGHDAFTSLTPAKLALKYDAEIIPAYVLRKNDSHQFRFVVDCPIRHGDPAEMMQKFNDIVANVISKDPAQWSWTIRRW